jgi:MFS family permease
VLVVAFLGLAAFVAATGMVGASAALLALTVAGTGFCLIGANNTLNAFATTLYPTEIRSTAVGWGGSFGRFMSGFAPIIGGVLLHELPLDTVFIIFALPALCGALAVAAMSWTRPARDAGARVPTADARA